MDDIDLEIDDGLTDLMDIDEFINNQIPSMQHQVREHYRVECSTSLHEENK